MNMGITDRPRQRAVHREEELINFLKEVLPEHLYDEYVHNNSDLSIVAWWHFCEENVKPYVLECRYSFNLSDYNSWVLDNKDLFRLAIL